jgi:hypothetical protein
MTINLRSVLTGFAILCLPTQAFACLVSPSWYDGWWDCRIDGRPSNVVWETKCVPVTTCSGGVCSSTYKVETKGWFREQNANWFTLIKNSSTAQSIRFTYTGDNTPWYLRYNAATRTAAGHTTWQGNQYPLTCTKM